MNETCAIRAAFTGTQHLWLFGVYLSVGWLLLLTALSLWNRLWAWMDDSKKVADNQLLLLMMRLGGYTRSREGAWRFYNKARKGADGEWGVVIPIVVLFIAPVVVVKFYTVALIIGTAIAIAHLARFTRRHKKLFDAHVKDTNAHKGDK